MTADPVATRIDRLCVELIAGRTSRADGLYHAVNRGNDRSWVCCDDVTMFGTRLDALRCRRCSSSVRGAGDDFVQEGARVILALLRRCVAVGSSVRGRLDGGKGFKAAMS